MKLLLLLALTAAIAQACIAISGDRILGSHMAQADQNLQDFPASVTVGFSPNPGAVRTFPSTEISRLARANGVALRTAPPEVCFELAMRTVTQGDALSAMRSVLAPNASLEITELPSTPVPVGDVYFPLTGLEHGQDVRTWRGFIQYAPTRRSPILARVRVRNAVESPVVRRGDVVSVDVRSGAAHVRLEAIAQRDGRSGDFVEFVNPVSGKRFQARVAEGATAVLVVGGGL